MFSPSVDAKDVPENGRRRPLPLTPERTRDDSKACVEASFDKSVVVRLQERCVNEKRR